MISGYGWFQVISAIEAFALIGGMFWSFSDLQYKRGRTPAEIALQEAAIRHKFILAHVYAYSVAVAIGLVAWLCYRAWRARQWTY